MLKLRVLTASILIVVFVLSIFYLSTVAVAILLSIFLLPAFREWFGLVGFKRFPSFLLLASAGIEFFLISFVLIPFLLFIVWGILRLFNVHWIQLSSFSWLQITEILSADFVAIALLTWASALFAVLTFPKHKQIYTRGRFGLTTGFFVLLPPYVSFLILHHKSPLWVLYPLILVWVADIAAFFVGRSFGKHKLAQKISPGKTWEGALGSFVGGAILAVAGYYFLDIHLHFVIWFLLNLLFVFFSIIGDLFESLFKRVQGIKDSGRLLPGHGGILDRIDSLTAVLPLFTAAMILLGQIKF